MHDIVTYDENLLKEQEQKIQEIYTKIGEQYYAAHRRDKKGEFRSLIKEVKACEKAIADHKAAVLRENGLLICPSCGEEISVRSLFCNFCGIRLSEFRSEDEDDFDEEPAAEEPAAADPVVEEPVVEEPAVEEPVVEEPAVEEPVVEEPDVAPVEPPLAAFPVTEAPKAEEKPTVCPQCGAALEDDCIFCVECGAPVKGGVKKEQPKPFGGNANAVRFCTECGFRCTDPEAMFCNNCGARLENLDAPSVPAPSYAPQEKQCPFCGFRTTDPEVMFCTECGTKLS